MNTNEFKLEHADNFRKWLVDNGWKLTAPAGRYDLEVSHRPLKNRINMDSHY